MATEQRALPQWLKDKIEEGKKQAIRQAERDTPTAIALDRQFAEAADKAVEDFDRLIDKTIQEKQPFKAKPPKKRLRDPKPKNYATRRISFKAPHKTKVNLLNRVIQENARLYPVAFKVIRDVLQQDAPADIPSYGYYQRAILGEVIRQFKPELLTDAVIRRTCKTVFQAVAPMWESFRMSDLTDEKIDAASFDYCKHAVTIPIQQRSAVLERNRSTKLNPLLHGMWLSVTLRDKSVLHVPVCVNKFTQRQILNGELVPREVSVFTRRLPVDHPDYWFEAGRRNGKMAAHVRSQNVVFLGDNRQLLLGVDDAEEAMRRLRRPVTVMVEGRQLCGSLVCAVPPAKVSCVTRHEPTDERIDGSPYSFEMGRGKAQQTVATPLTAPRRSLYAKHQEEVDNLPKVFLIDDPRGIGRNNVGKYSDVDVVASAFWGAVGKKSKSYEATANAVYEAKRRSAAMWRVRTSNRVVRDAQLANLRSLPGRSGSLSRASRIYLDKECPSRADRQTLVEVASLLASLDQRIVETLYLDEGNIDALQRYVYTGCVAPFAGEGTNEFTARYLADTLTNKPGRITSEAMRIQWDILSSWLVQHRTEDATICEEAKELLRWTIERCVSKRAIEAFAWA